jgi:hypothetical protein
MNVRETNKGDYMKMTIEQLKEKLANKVCDNADLDALLDYFREGQYAYYQTMTESELKEFASEYLGYNVDEEL